jgi:flagellin-like hook-associated protein FlgL
MKDIATQAANAGLTASDRTALNATFAQLSVHVGNLLKGATVNSTNLLGSAAFISDASVITGDQVIQTGLTSSNFTTIVSANLNTGGGLAANGFLNIDGLSLTTQGNASDAIDVLTAALNTISNKQSIVSAEQTGLKELSKAALSMATNLQSTVDSIQNVDETELQAKLQQLNNQQSIDYYLISQMNTAAAAILTIFR